MSPFPEPLSLNGRIARIYLSVRRRVYDSYVVTCLKCVYTAIILIIHGSFNRLFPLR